MATEYEPGDGIHELLRKILERLNTGLSTEGSGENSSRGSSVVVQFTPDLTALTYAVYDHMGTGPYTLAGALKQPPEGTGYASGVLQHVTIVDRDGLSPELELILFRAEPSATWSDSGAFTLSSDDANLVLARVSILASDWIRVGSGSDVTQIASITGLGHVLRSADATATSLYAALVSLGSPTFTSASALRVSIGIIQD